MNWKTWTVFIFFLEFIIKLGCIDSQTTHSILLGGSSHLVNGLVHPSYKCTNPTYPIEKTMVITHLLSGMNHQVSISSIDWCIVWLLQVEDAGHCPQDAKIWEAAIFHGGSNSVFDVSLKGFIGDFSGIYRWKMLNSMGFTYKQCWELPMKNGHFYGIKFNGI